MRQVELADDDFDIHAEVVFVAENLDYSPGLSAGEGQSVISTSTTRPSRSFHSRRRASSPRTRSRSADFLLVGFTPLLSHSLANEADCPALAKGGLERGTRRTASASDSASLWLAGHSIPRGMMISRVTFSSLGVT